ncbi:MAG: amidohydrolase family protein [Hyphomonadaceae bacterium]
MALRGQSDPSNDLIDIHAHFVPKSFPDDPTGGKAAWPSMHCAVCGTKATVKTGGKPFRELDDRSWDPLRRIGDMDADGVRAQALSPMPELLSYWFDVEPAIQLCRHVNGEIADVVAKHSSRFYGLGGVPMQDPVRAAEEMRRVKDMGLHGIEVGSNISGKYLGSAHFDPVYAAAVELDLCIFVHALHPLSTPHLGDHAGFAPFINFPVDTALCAATIIMDGVLERFPSLRIGFSHGGGVFAPMLHRMEHGWKITNGFNGKLPQTPRAYAKRFFYDSLVYEPAYLKHLAAHVAPGQIFLGTDYPYSIMQPEPGNYIRGLVEATGDQTLWSGAARRFLNQPAG